jgi:hypothetical protein
LYFTQSRGGMSVFRFEELLAPLVGLPGQPARTRVAIEKLQPLVGAYHVASGPQRAWVTSYRKRLRLELAGQAALLPLWPDNAGRWAFGESAPGLSVSFETNVAGESLGMRLWQNDKQLLEYRRVAATKDLPSVQHVMAFRRQKQGGGAIDALQSVEMKGKLTAGAAQLDNTIIAASPDRIIRRISSRAGMVITAVDGGRAQKHTPGQPIEELKGLLHEEALRISPLARLRDWRETSTAVRVAGKTHFGGEDAWILRIEREFEPPLTRYVSATTGLLRKEEAWITAKGLGTVPITIVYDDYRDVAGVKLPFRLTTESAITGKQTMRYTEAKPNPEINASTFVVPSQ